MGKVTIGVPGAGDIETALHKIGDQVLSRLDNKESRNLSMLLCEEMLLHIFHIGGADIRISAGGVIRPYIVITAEGEADELFGLDKGRDRDDLQYEINRNILKQYDSFIDHRFIRNRNIYRIYIRPDNTELLKDEILEYYSTQCEEKRKKPLGILKWIGRKHPVMAALGLLFRTVRHAAALLLPVFASNIIQAFYDHHEFFTMPVYRNLIASCIALTVNLTVAWFENRVYQRFTRELESALKLALVEKLQLMTFKYHNETPDGMLVSRMASDIQFIKYLFYDFSTFILFMIEDMVFTAVISCIRLPLMLAVYGVLLPLYFILIRIFAGQLQERKAFMRVKTENSDAMFKEMLSMDQMIRASGLQQAQTRRIGRSFREALKAAVLHDNVQLRFNSVVYGLTQGFRLVVMVMAVIFASRGYIEIGSVVLFLSLLDITITSTEKVLEMSPQITQCFDSLYSINELLSENDVEKNGTRTLPRPVKGEIVFKDVSFGYDTDKPILDHVDLTFSARKTTALTGRSGSGKTTILNLILGLYQKDSGQLLIDGIDIDELDKNDYRHLIAVVLQTPLLFHASLWDNLTYGLNYCSTSQVMDVLDKVGLASLVRDNDDGFDMQVLEGGSNLSGGQRQRIAIARALLRKPDIIILDEATSALDTESEKEVQAVLESVMRTCTVIVSAHRLSTIKKADAVYEIRDGKAVRYDSYEQLFND